MHLKSVSQTERGNYKPNRDRELNDEKKNHIAASVISQNAI